MRFGARRPRHRPGDGRRGPRPAEHPQVPAGAADRTAADHRPRGTAARGRAALLRQHRPTCPGDRPPAERGTARDGGGPRAQPRVLRRPPAHRPRHRADRPPRQLDRRPRRRPSGPPVAQARPALQRAARRHVPDPGVPAHRAALHRQDRRQRHPRRAGHPRGRRTPRQRHPLLAAAHQGARHRRRGADRRRHRDRGREASASARRPAPRAEAMLARAATRPRTSTTWARTPRLGLAVVGRLMG